MHTYVCVCVCTSLSPLSHEYTIHLNAMLAVQVSQNDIFLTSASRAMTVMTKPHPGLGLEKV